MKVTSKRLAAIAAEYVKCPHFHLFLFDHEGREVRIEGLFIQELAASVLSQTEPKPKAKRKTAKVKR